VEGKEEYCMSPVEIESRLTALEREVAALRDQVEQAEIVAAMREGVAEIERGEGRPAVEAVEALARRMGIPKP
jgi:hypothetical protein